MAALEIEIYVAGEMQTLHIKINTLPHKFNTLDIIMGNENYVTYENSCRSFTATDCCTLTSACPISGLAIQVIWGCQNIHVCKKNQWLFVRMEGINDSPMPRCQFSTHSSFLRFLGSSLSSLPQFRQEILHAKSDAIPPASAFPKCSLSFFLSCLETNMSLGHSVDGTGFSLRQTPPAAVL